MIDDLEYQRHDAVGLASLVARGEVSPTDLLDAAQRITAARNPAINAVTTDLDDFARAEIAHGLPAGPFRGVPFLLKDQYQQLTGTVTTHGCRVFADAVADHDSTLTARYRAAGFRDVKVKVSPGRPELQLEIDRQKAADLGVGVAQVAMALRTAMEGAA